MQSEDKETSHCGPLTQQLIAVCSTDVEAHPHNLHVDCSYGFFLLSLQSAWSKEGKCLPVCLLLTPGSFTLTSVWEERAWVHECVFVCMCVCSVWVDMLYNVRSPSLRLPLLLPPFLIHLLPHSLSLSLHLSFLITEQRRSRGSWMNCRKSSGQYIYSKSRMVHTS